ncbi:MAG: lysozyme inhibitor LprI family protein [Deltaproteobacteria bacterium]|nr:lysozyme inhibitor LprI family protein [Deltaproteobacteria bacterium]
MLRASLAAALAYAVVHLAFPHALAAQPSFDCRKATSSVEITICNNSDLSMRDGVMSDLYNDARNSPYIDRNDLLRSQRAWWRKRENQCGRSRQAVKCLEDLYSERIDELNFMLYGRVY